MKLLTIAVGVLRCAPPCPDNARLRRGRDRHRPAGECASAEGDAGAAHEPTLAYIRDLGQRLASATAGPKYPYSFSAADTARSTRLRSPAARSGFIAACCIRRLASPRSPACWRTKSHTSPSVTPQTSSRLPRSRTWDSASWARCWATAAAQAPHRSRPGFLPTAFSSSSVATMSGKRIGWGSTSCGEPGGMAAGNGGALRDSPPRVGSRSRQRGSIFLEPPLAAGPDDAAPGRRRQAAGRHARQSAVPGIGPAPAHAGAPCHAATT